MATVLIRASGWIQVKVQTLTLLVHPALSTPSAWTLVASVCSLVQSFSHWPSWSGNTEFCRVRRVFSPGWCRAGRRVVLHASCLYKNLVCVTNCKLLEFEVRRWFGSHWTETRCFHQRRRTDAGRTSPHNDPDDEKNQTKTATKQISSEQTTNSDQICSCVFHNIGNILWHFTLITF